MKRIILIVSLLIAAIIGFSCTKTIIPSPDQLVEYEQGVAVIKSVDKNGVVVRLISNQFDSENPPALYVMVANLSNEPFLFSTQNISAEVKGEKVKVYTYEDLKRQIEIERTLNEIAIGLDSASQSFMAAQPRYSYTYGNINTFGYGSYGGSASTYYSGSTWSYDPARVAKAQSAINANATNQMAAAAANARIQTNNLKVILRENTIKPGEYCAGVIKLDPSSISYGSQLTLRIDTPQDNHLFYFDIPNLSAASENNKRTPTTALVLKKKKSVEVTQQEKINRLSERWKKIGAVQSEIYMFVDTKTISYPSENIIRIWLKTIEKEIEFLDLLETDCSENKIRILEEQSDKNPIFSGYSSEWKFIAPESTPETIYNAVCPINK